jgi:hydrogenase maturation protein HypF
LKPVGAVATSRRARIRVQGVVQGVGFRPFVLRRARELGLSGFVRNDTRGVLIEAEGAAEAIDQLVADLPVLAPPLARVASVAVDDLALRGGDDGFTITASDPAGEPLAFVSADGATCDACLAELRDPGDRRHRYPFINCTDCGPRFTIIRGVPYDRPLTTMAAFTMCAPCLAEYHDPSDRRFHAQPNACPDCGPRVRLLGGSGGASGDAVSAAAALLRDGAILAVKGLGGYHLACRADDEQAVARLRARKHREDKPFALMAPDVRGAAAIAVLSAAETALLESVARPIVLVRRREHARVAAAVAPASRDLGVMLPYTPLHHLLLADAGTPLVLTSGNHSDEPIAYRDADAQTRLAAIADGLLVHDRPIHIRTDDSVVRVAAGHPTVLRRARGLVPERLALPTATARPLLACGAHLKSTICVAKGTSAWVSHHIGDLDDAATRLSLAEAVAHFEALFAVVPEVVVHDEHPDYASTRFALDLEGVEHLAVQHHHAHMAAVLAEHGCAADHRAVAAIYDGSGLGRDGTTWGGELLVGDQRGFERVGHLHPVALPGGDRAARQPWRMAAAWLVAANGPEDALPDPPAALRDVVPAGDWKTICEMARRGFSAPPTTSMGRLLDAVSALCGVRAVCTYEGQAAIELEALADRSHRGAYDLPVSEDGVLDARPLIRAVAADVADGVGPAIVSARAHHAVAQATARTCVQLAGRHATRTVVLSGGVFQNRILLEETVAALEQAGLQALVAQRLPANDGGISFGQAAVAAATDGRG